MNFACPCCANLTLRKLPPGTYEICPVCYWEDDPIQYNDPTFEGGANKICLNEAKKNYTKFSAVEKRYLNNVRKPLPEEIPR